MDHAINEVDNWVDVPRHMSSLDGVPDAESHLNGDNLAPEDEDIDAILVANVTSGGVIKTLAVNQSDQNSKADKKVQLGELACAAWDKDFKLSISAGEIECSICGVSYCSKCTNFELSDINGVMKRGDMIWACPSWHAVIISKHAKNKINHWVTKTWMTTLNKNWRNYWGKNITLSINNIVPKVGRECLENVHKWASETVTQDVKQLWSETLYGSD